MTGAFKGSDSKTMFETGFDSKALSKAKDDLQSSKLVYFVQGWIIVPDADEKTQYSKGEKTQVAYKKEFELLPELIQEIIENKEILDTLSDDDDRVSEVGATSDIHRNHKTEIINSSLVLSSYQASLAEMRGDQEYLTSLAEKYHTTPSFVLSKLDDLENWIEERPSRAKGRNLKKTLPQWVKKDAIQLKERSKNERPNLVVLPGSS